MAQVHCPYHRMDKLQEFTVRAAPEFARIAEQTPVVSVVSLQVLQDVNTHELVRVAVAVLLPEELHRKGEFTAAAVLALHDSFSDLCLAAFGPKLMEEVIELDALRERAAKGGEST